MSTALRAHCLALGLAAALMTGCDKSATTASGGGTTTTAPGRGGDTAGSKLAGVWEGAEEPKKGEPDFKSMVEFKNDGGLSMVMGPFDLTGTWKLAKDEGKTVTIDTEMTAKDDPDRKSKRMTFKITFDDDNTITMTPTEKDQPMKLKRKK